jgi:hypothetical protein
MSLDRNTAGTTVVVETPAEPPLQTLQASYTGS